MKDRQHIIKEVVHVRRWQLGQDGLEEVFVQWDRTQRVAFMSVNGILQWEVSEHLAEEFFNRYGLLIKENNGN